MLLAIDSGNTNLVFAVMQGEQVLAQWRMETNDRRTADEYFVWLSHLAASKGLDVGKFTAVIIANVRPASQFALDRLCHEYLGLRPLVVGQEPCRFDLEVKVTSPEQVGADRLVNAFAAKHLIGGPAILIDTGTATTLDILDAQGAYAGGIIAPGVHVSAQALANAAAQLPLVPVEQPASPIGTDTRSAIQSGLYWGYISLLEGLIERSKAAMRSQGHAPRGQAICVLGTGGLIRTLNQNMTALDRVESDLTLIGLREIYRLNQEN